MRSNVALTAGVLLGATLGLACLFVLKPGEAKVSPIGAAGSQTKRTATVAKAPAAAPGTNAKPAAAASSAAPAATKPATTSKLAGATRSASTSGGRTALPSMLARSGAAKPASTAKVVGAGYGRSVASAVSVESPASARKVATADVPRNAIEARISGFAQGIDMRRPVTLAGGPTSRAAIATGQRPAAAPK